MLSRTLLKMLCLLVLSAPIAAGAQTPWHTDVETDWLQQVMPGADRFSDKSGDPPVWRGYREAPDNGGETLAGYVFLSGDVPPERTGYSAPIDMLIGVDTDGRLTGLKILNYFESYVSTRGDFLSEGDFQAQFREKPISDEFWLSRDIDGVSRATVSSRAVAEGARDAARRVARAYLDYQPVDAETQRRRANAQARLAQMDWQQMRDSGMIRELSVPMPEGRQLRLFLTYVGKPVLGEHFVGTNDWGQALREAREYLGGGEMILVAIGGDRGAGFLQERLAIQQGTNAPIKPVPRRRFVYAGDASEGAIAGHAHYAGAIVLDDSIDISEPFRVIYQRRDGANHGVDYQLGEFTLALARDETVPSPAELERQRLAEASFLYRALQNAPWGDTPWGRVLILAALLSLVMAAFLRKSPALRWSALTLTLAWLGFIDGGFLSVSHITGALAQGPALFLDNLPLLMIVTFTLGTTLLWGRVFCSSLCPFGALQDIMTRLSPRRWQRRVPQWLHDRALYLKYGFLALIIGAALVAPQLSLFQYFEPFGTLFFFSSSWLLWLILLAILAGCVIVPRFYCRYMCPLGASLGLVSLLSPLRIRRVPQCQVCKVCEHACPTGAIRGPAIDFKECVRCDICERKLLDRAGVCKHDMADVARRHKDWSTVRIVDP